MYRQYLTILMIVVFSTIQVVSANTNGVRVATTFQYLADDVSLLLCSGDEAYSIVPVGADPHEYSLTPKDVEFLKTSHIIISTSHTHLERRIYELIISGELNSSLIEVPKLPKVNIRYIPNTNIVNYHAVTYDPDNYIILMETIARELSRLRPECSSTYMENLNKVVKHVEKIKKAVELNNLTAVGSSPLTQYAVEWLGVKVITYLVIDPEAPPTPSDISHVEKVLSNRLATMAVVVDSDSAIDRALNEIAVKYSIPILKIPSPIAPGSTIDKLETIISNYRNLTLKTADIYEREDYMGLTLLMTLTSIIILMYALRRVSTWK
ncbi:MAG: zinc ABC transporter substrate-binding protein [Sulfolobales archaeon]